MIILTLRTDKPEAEIGLFDGKNKLSYKTWQAHRQLAETLHSVVHEQLTAAGYDWNNIEGIVAYQGPGSFTGLRIGLSTANALAASLQTPIVGAQTEDWLSHGLEQLISGNNDKVVFPFYGADPHITQQKK